MSECKQSISSTAYIIFEHVQFRWVHEHYNTDPHGNVGAKYTLTLKLCCESIAYSKHAPGSKHIPNVLHTYRSVEQNVWLFTNKLHSNYEDLVLSDHSLCVCNWQVVISPEPSGWKYALVCDSSMHTSPLSHSRGLHSLMRAQTSTNGSVVYTYSVPFRANNWNYGEISVCRSRPPLHRRSLETLASRQWDETGKTGSQYGQFDTPQLGTVPVIIMISEILAA